MGSFASLDPNNPDGQANDINDSGQIMGYRTAWPDVNDPSYHTKHAFLYTDGNMVDLGAVEDDEWSIAYAINNSGQIVGVDSIRAFLYTDGNKTSLYTLFNGNNYGPSKRTASTTPGRSRVS